MLLLKDDTEDAPWMVMGDLQFWSASSFAQSLRIYAREQDLDWYVAAMLPITFEWPGMPTKRTLSPDTFVAFVARRARASYDVSTEGTFPPFVLEVVSPSSAERDREEKRLAYGMLGVREYALFRPLDPGPSTLDGFRCNADGIFEPWPADEQGRLWSEVLGLYLVVRGAMVQAQTLDGRLLLSPEQEAEERRRVESALLQEAQALQRAEEEIERLKRELERLRSQSDGKAG